MTINPKKCAQLARSVKRLQGAVEQALHHSTAHRERDTDILQDLLCDAVEDIDL